MTSRRKRIGLVLVGVALAAVFGGWLIIVSRFDGYRIPVESMEPTLQVGDRVWARAVQGEDVSPGDIVIFTAPDRSSRSQIERISRVIAVEGDEVDTEDGSLVINGEKVHEPYLRAGTSTTDLAPTTVPAGHVFVLSDNRGNAQDSRVLGPVALENIYALVSLRWWPLSGFGGLQSPAQAGVEERGSGCPGIGRVGMPLPCSLGFDRLPESSVVEDALGSCPRWHALSGVGADKARVVSRAVHPIRMLPS